MKTMVLRMKAPLLTDIPGRFDFLTTRVAVEAALNNHAERECAQAEAPGGPACAIAPRRHPARALGKTLERFTCGPKVGATQS